ncbi:MAG: hypothetical protein AB7I08_20000 [Thermoleophilia bacterium]
MPRFTLLAFVPTVSGAAIALLGAGDLEREKTVLAAIGLLVTFGILLYDQRNTQFHNGAISRAKHLERLLGGWTVVLCDAAGAPWAESVAAGAAVGALTFLQLPWRDASRRRS